MVSRAKFWSRIMSAHSNKPYTTPRLTQQQRDDVLLEVVNQVGSLTKKLDTMWAHLFDKPRSSNNPKHEENGDHGGIEKEANFTIGDHSQLPPFQHSHWVTHTFMEERNFQPQMEHVCNRMETPERQIDNTMRQVHVDVLDFHGKMNLYAF